MKYKTTTWLGALENGEILECSYDKHTWFDLIEEPIVGDGKYYRVKPKDENNNTQLQDT